MKYFEVKKGVILLKKTVNCNFTSEAQIDATEKSTVPPSILSFESGKLRLLTSCDTSVRSAVSLRAPCKIPTSHARLVRCFNIIFDCFQ